MPWLCHGYKLFASIKIISHNIPNSFRILGSLDNLKNCGKVYNSIHITK